MKRKRTGAVHTAWDNIFVRWTGEECWWKHITADGRDEWTSFFQIASGLVKNELLP